MDAIRGSQNRFGVGTQAILMVIGAGGTQDIGHAGVIGDVEPLRRDSLTGGGPPV